MKSKFFKETIAPSLVLVLICLVIPFALVLTNSVTKPQIEKIAKANADKTRSQVLPTADSFTKYKGKLSNGIVEFYIANNKSGGVVTAQGKSFGGTLTAMIGIDKDGAITGVEVTNHSDTPGLGTKAMTKEYLKKYQKIKELKGAKIKDEKSVDHVVGASISSNGVYTAVKNALAQFKDAGGIK